MKIFGKGWWCVRNICKCVIFAITFQIPILWFVKTPTFVCIHMSSFESQPKMSHSFSFSLCVWKDLPLSIGYSVLLSWSSCWQSWRKRKMIKLVLRDPYSVVFHEKNKTWIWRCRWRWWQWLATQLSTRALYGGTPWHYNHPKIILDRSNFYTISNSRFLNLLKTPKQIKIATTQRG